MIRPLSPFTGARRKRNNATVRFSPTFNGAAIDDGQSADDYAHRLLGGTHTADTMASTGGASSARLLKRLK
jgi:hypothetical protein